MQTFLNNIGLVLGVVGILATIFFAIRYAERKEPRAYVANDRKITLSLDAVGEMELLYHGKRIPTLTSTYVWFWNEGRRPIKRDDIAAKQPIRIHIRQDGDVPDILNVSVLKTTRESIGFQATAAADGTVELSFDFLDYRDGALVEIQHTGPSWVETVVTGVILGCPKGIAVSQSEVSNELVSSFVFPLEKDWRQIRRSRMRRWILSAAGVVAALVGVYAIGTEREITTTRPILSAALRPFVPSADMPAAIAAVEEKDKWPLLNSTGRYAVWLLLGLVLLGIVAGLLRRVPTLPETLALRYEPERTADNEHGSNPSPS